MIKYPSDFYWDTVSAVGVIDGVIRACRPCRPAAYVAALGNLRETLADRWGKCWGGSEIAGLLRALAVDDVSAAAMRRAWAALLPGTEADGVNLLDKATS